MSYYTKMKTKSIVIYIYIDIYIYNRIGFSSEVSLMYRKKGIFKRGEKGKGDKEDQSD